MTTKELFLDLKSYEDFLKQKKVFKGLVIDEEIHQHIKKIFPEVYPPTGMIGEMHFEIPRTKENEWLFKWK